MGLALLIPTGHAGHSDGQNRQTGRTRTLLLEHVRMSAVPHGTFRVARYLAANVRALGAGQRKFEGADGLDRYSPTETINPNNLANFREEKTVLSGLASVKLIAPLA